MSMKHDAITGNEIVMPYGNANGSLHLRLKNEDLTFCGRNSYGWSLSETTLSEWVDDSIACKRCLKAAIK